VLTIFEDSRNQLCLGLKGYGVSRLIPGKDGERGSIIHFSRLEGMREGDVFALAEDRSGRIWAATLGGSIAMLDVAAGARRFVSFLPTTAPLKNNIRALFTDSYGRLWLWGDNNLLLCLQISPSGSILHDYCALLGEEEESIQKLSADASGRLLRATVSSGLLILEEEAGPTRLQHSVLSLPEEMPITYLHDVEASSSGKIWLATSDGGGSML